MQVEDLLNNGYFPKELPPCFITELYGNNFQSIIEEVSNNESSALSTLLNNIDNNQSLVDDQKSEERSRIKQIFTNRLNFSEPVKFTIPKIGLSLIEESLNKSSLVRNNPPINKVTGYLKSKISMMRGIAGVINAKGFNKEKVDERREEIIEFCVKRFPLK